MAVDLLEHDERGEADHGGATVEHLDLGDVGELGALEVGPEELGVHLRTLELGHEGGKGEKLQKRREKKKKTFFSRGNNFNRRGRMGRRGGRDAFW